MVNFIAFWGFLVFGSMDAYSSYEEPRDQVFDTAVLEDQRDRLLLEGELVQPLETVGPGTGSCKDVMTKIFPWERDLGTGEFNVNLYADVTLKGDCQSAGADLIATAVATVFSVDNTIFDARLIANSDTSSSTLERSVMLMGYEVDAGIDRVSTRKVIRKNWQLPININRQKNVWLGPIPIKFSYGLIGSVKIPLVARLNLAAADLKSDISADVDAYIEGVISLQDQAKASGKGRMTVFDESMYLHAASTLKNPLSAERYFQLRADGRSDLLALEGELVAKAEVAGESWSRQFFYFDGFEDKRVMFKYQKNLDPYTFEGAE